MRDPTLQFFLVLLTAPLCAMMGVSTSHLTDFPISYAGWFITLCLCSLFAARSARHLWRKLPSQPGGKQLGLWAIYSIELRLLVGVTTFALLTAVIALVVLVLLLLNLWRLPA
jgi:hypothetical protein